MRRRPSQRPEDTSARRLVQDFVTAPVPLASVLPQLAGQPSTIPSLVAMAASASTTCRPDVAAVDVRVVGERPRPGGWSVQLGWPDGACGLPGFDGELVLHELIPDSTWVALEGAVSLALSGELSDRELRHAQWQLRRLLTSLSEVLSGPLDMSGSSG